MRKALVLSRFLYYVGVFPADARALTRLLQPLLYLYRLDFRVSTRVVEVEFHRAKSLCIFNLRVLNLT